MSRQNHLKWRSEVLRRDGCMGNWDDGGGGWGGKAVACLLLRQWRGRNQMCFNASIHMMFYDFSSVFNTLQPHLLADKLSMVNVLPTLIPWVLDYLTHCSQFVKLQSNSNTNCPQSCCALLSDVLAANTGVPQGTVLSLSCLHSTQLTVGLRTTTVLLTNMLTTPH